MSQMHACPAPGCPHRVPFNKFACHVHWYSIPEPLRDEVWRAFREEPQGPAHINALKAAGDFLDAQVDDKTPLPRPVTR